MKTVKHYMKTKVVHVKPQHSIFDAARILSKKHISGAPVVDKGRVVGIISEEDIIKFMGVKLPKDQVYMDEPHVLTMVMANFVKEGIDFIREVKKLSQSSVSAHMSKNVIFTTSSATLIEAAEVMAKHKIDRLPVIDRGKLKGIISRADLVRAILE